MLRRHAVAAGLAVGGMGQLYYGAVALQFGGYGALLQFVTGLALIQAAVGVGARHGWTFGVGTVVAGLASYDEFQEILFESYSLAAVAGALEGLGIILVAVAALLWALRHRDDLPHRLDEEAAVLVLRAGAVLAVLSAVVYRISSFPGLASQWLPGNLLVMGGFGLVAYAARAPLMGEDEPREEPERPSSEAGSRPS